MIRKDIPKFLKGSDVYSPFVLSLYDLFVLRFSNRFLWKCPTKELVSLYNRNVSGEHLDIGVGTGGQDRTLESTLPNSEEAPPIGDSDFGAVQPDPSPSIDNTPSEVGVTDYYSSNFAG